MMYPSTHPANTAHQNSTSALSADYHQQPNRCLPCPTGPGGRVRCATREGPGEGQGLIEPKAQRCRGGFAGAHPPDIHSEQGVNPRGYVGASAYSCILSIMLLHRQVKLSASQRFEAEAEAAAVSWLSVKQTRIDKYQGRRPCEPCNQSYDVCQALECV